MSFLDILKEPAGRLVSWLSALRMPAEIPASYAATGPLAGTYAGRYLLEHTAGLAQYRWTPAPIANLQKVVSERQQCHRFATPDELARYVADDSSITFWVSEKNIVIAQNENEPDAFHLVCEIKTSEELRRWPNSATLHLPELVELATVGRDDFVDQCDGQLIRSLSATRTQSLDEAAEENGGSARIKVTFKAGSRSKDGEVALPDRFDVRIPWWLEEPAGVELPPAHFSLRMLPPVDGQPSRFQLEWLDYRQHQLAALYRMRDHLSDLVEGPVYIGEPSSTHWLIPPKG